MSETVREWIDQAEADHGPTTRGPWRRLTGLERWATALTITMIAAMSLPAVAPGVCFDDAGDLQVACATLGIAHPPGYMGYTGVGWVLCRLFSFAEPAYVVSLACFGCMIGALALLMVLLIRMGLHVLMGSALVLALTAHTWVWQALTVPEVYAPSLLCLAGTTYLLIKYGRLHRRRDLYVAAALLGFLVVNRPPALLAAPGFVAALVTIEWRRGAGVRDTWRALVGSTACCGGVVLAVLALLWVRDTPQTSYNYITQYAQAHDGLGYDGDEPATRWQRLAWLVTAHEYRSMAGANLSQVFRKAGWIGQQLHLGEPGRFVCAAALLALGSFILARRGGEWVLLAWGILLGSAVYLLQYRVRGSAADLLPVLFAGSLVLGATLAVLFPRTCSQSRAAAALIVCLGIGAATWHHTSGPRRASNRSDARRFVTELDFASLPPDSVLCARWAVSRPLWYARWLQADRQDVQVLTADRKLWPQLAARWLDRPVFYTSRAATPPGWHLLPWRNVWRLVRTADLTSTVTRFGVRAGFEPAARLGWSAGRAVQT